MNSLKVIDNRIPLSNAKVTRRETLKIKNKLEKDNLDGKDSFEREI
jgi:hypothetical protein